MSKPNLPSIPPSRSGDQTVDRLKELVEIWKGERGNPLDQAVTYRELVKAGLGKVSRAGVLSSAVVIDNDTGGVVGESQTVSPLSNLSAVGGFRLVIVDWDGTQQAAYAYTEVWRATEDNLANAVLIGTSIASLYSDTNVISGQEYFYWVRAVSVTNNKSAFNATAGESATPVLEPDYIIGLIEGLIGASELAAEVLTPIQAIPSIQTTLSELGIEVPALDGRLTTAEGTLLTQSGQITALQSSLNDLTVNPFDANETYDLNDLFSYSGTTYRVIATQTPPNATPPNATYYEEATDVESLADTVAANTGAINALDARVVATEGGISSQASQIVQLTADLSDTNNNVSGNTSAISALDSRTTSTETGLAAVGSNVQQLQAELDAAELAIQGNSDATSALESRVEVNEDTVSAHSSDITLLQNGLTDAQGEAQANSTALGLLDAQVQTHDGEITAQGASIAQIENTVDDPVTGVVATSNGLSALSGRVDVTENEISAISSDVQTLEAEVDGNRAAVQTKAEASVVQDLEDQIIVLQAKWVLQVDVNGHVAGIALANDGEQSELVIASSAVYFIDPDQSSVEFNPNTNYASIAALRQTQFIFGYALVEGQRRFVINVPAYIPDGTITSAQISNAVINMAQIVDLKVSAAEIDDAAITSAKLASVIQSDNFLSGLRGWRILRSGHAEFNDIAIYDPNGTLAFASGQNYLVTVDSVNTDAWLSEYYDFTIQEQGLGVKGLKLESYPNGIIPEEDYLDYGFGVNNGAVVGGLAPAFDDLPYTVSTKAHRVYPGRNYTIELDFLPYSPRVGSYQLRAYEYDSDLSAGVEYVVGAVGHSDPQCVLYDRSVLIDTSTYPASAPYDVVLSEAYTPSSTARWVSFALAITSNGPDLVIIKTFGLKGQRTQVSSTFIEDAAIKAAHIEDASITSAKIKKAAVERLSILDGAVTAVAVAESDVQQEWYSETFSWQTFGTLLFTHEHETTLPCVLQQYVEYTDTQNAMEWRVRMDGVTQETFNGQMPPAYVLEVPPGGVTIELQGHALTSSVPARYWSVDKYVAHIEAGQR